MTAWTDFIVKIYNEGRGKDSTYSYKQAMKDASKRKGEMGSPSSTTPLKQGKTKKARKSRKARKARKSRKNRM